MTKLENYLKESSLSRILKHNINHDCGALTAFRKARDCGAGEKYTHKENQKRNKSLKAKLLSMGYNITSVRGKYPEGGKIQREDSFFIVDSNDTGSLETDIIKLGIIFDQDSILYIPKGSVSQEDNAYLIGTNKCSNNWLGYGKKEFFEKGRFGVDSKIYTTYVNGRPFIFEDIGVEEILPASGMGIWAMHLMANKNWNDIED